ncbi:hypothetical protein DFH07DRAFT_939447, partial [Mycena maculata]
MSKFDVLGGNGTSKAGAYQISTKSGGRIKSYGATAEPAEELRSRFFLRHDRRQSISTNSLSFGDFLGSFYSHDSALLSGMEFGAHSTPVIHATYPCYGSGFFSESLGFGILPDEFSGEPIPSWPDDEWPCMSKYFISK